MKRSKDLDRDSYADRKLECGLSFPVITVRELGKLYSPLSKWYSSYHREPLGFGISQRDPIWSFFLNGAKIRAQEVS